MNVLTQRIMERYVCAGIHVQREGRPSLNNNIQYHQTGGRRTRRFRLIRMANDNNPAAGAAHRYIEFPSLHIMSSPGGVCVYIYIYLYNRDGSCVEHFGSSFTRCAITRRPATRSQLQQLETWRRRRRRPPHVRRDQVANTLLRHNNNPPTHLKHQTPPSSSFRGARRAQHFTRAMLWIKLYGASQLERLRVSLLSSGPRLGLVCKVN